MADVSAIDALLPQTQCGECGFSGCRPYAEALAQQAAPINRCPPGGVATLKALGRILNQDPTPYLKDMAQSARKPAAAYIRETECIGCTKCIQACPVDAIVGSAKSMHTVIAAECTGCGLCVEPCPVDCIEMMELPEPNYDKDQARKRFKAREIRRLQQQQEKEQAYREKRKLSAKSHGSMREKNAKKDFILQALARVEAKKNKSLKGCDSPNE